MQAAHRFARDLGRNFSLGGEAANLPVGGKPGISLGRVVSFELDPKGISMTNNLLGFGNGYNDGVAYYFQHVE